MVNAFSALLPFVPAAVDGVGGRWRRWSMAAGGGGVCVYGDIEGMLLSDYAS